jgi:hypothetical protein
MRRQRPLDVKLWLRKSPPSCEQRILERAMGFEPTTPPWQGTTSLTVANLSPLTWSIGSYIGRLARLPRRSALWLASGGERQTGNRSAPVRLGRRQGPRAARGEPPCRLRIQLATASRSTAWKPLRHLPRGIGEPRHEPKRPCARPQVRPGLRTNEC